MSPPKSLIPTFVQVERGNKAFCTGVIHTAKKDGLVPDKIPILGIVDDIAVIGLALKMCEPELQAFKNWKKA